MMKLTRLTEKLNILSFNADSETEISSVCYDSRKACEGCLFVAIKGLTSDGHRYIPDVAAKGCAAVICEEKPSCDIPYVLVEDSRKALALVSCAFYNYPADKMHVIGVTGTSGKTTSTNLIKHILERSGEKVGLVGTNGNMIGSEMLHAEYTTPESLELQELFAKMVEAGCGYAVMEVSSHSIYMDRIAGIQYSTALFTNLSQDHLDFHKTMEEYASVKRRLFSVCDKCSINLDDEWSPFMLESLSVPVISTSVTDEKATLYAKNLKLTASSVEFTAVYGGEELPVHLAIPGMFSVYNALTAIAACLSEGISLKDCALGLASAAGVKGRVENVPTDGDYSIIIDYSHKPDPLEKVLKTLREVTKGRLICLFGCGGDRDRVKRPIMASIAAENSDYVIVTTDNPRTEEPQEIIDEILTGMEGKTTPYDVVVDRIEAIHHAIDIAQNGDVILLAGKGHEDYQVIGHEKIHMDEREIVSQYLEERKHVH